MSAVSFHSSHLDLRYDDLTQHGHIKQSALQLVLGHICFGVLWVKHPLYDTRLKGILPILSRLVLEAEAMPVSFAARVEGRGRIELAHQRAEDGNVSALFMNSYGELWGPRSHRQSDGARTRSKSEPREHALIGRAFGEHVFTKPFAKPGQRKVLAFDVPGEASIPSERHNRVSLRDTTALPTEAEWLDDEFLPDDSAMVFGLTHTDANQHVNSLVYSRVFEEAVLRRLAKHGHNAGLLGRRIELNYRKPSFSGDRMMCMVRCYRWHGELGATGYLAPEGEPLERAHCSFDLRMRLVA